MFSLIITLIAIALVSALALASIYYGGTAFNSGVVETKATEIIFQGETISAALITAEMGGEYPESIQDLVDLGYLKSIPKAGGKTWSPQINSKYHLIQTVVDDLCDLINEKAGISTKETLGLEIEHFGCNTANDVYYNVGEFTTAPTPPPA